MPTAQTIATSKTPPGGDSVQARFIAFRDRQIRVLEQLAAGAPLSRTLESVARMIQEQSPGTLASVLVLDTDGVHLRHGAAPDLPGDYNKAVDGLAIGPSVGSCGTAAFLGRRVIVNDIATDPLWANFKGIALQHGLRSCWSEPILDSKGNVLGSFAMYHRYTAEPDDEDLQIIRVAAHLAGIAIERHRGDQARRAAEQEHEAMEQKIAMQQLKQTAIAEERLLLERILESALAGYWDWHVKAATVYLSPRFKKMFGYEDHELPNSPETWQKLILPEDQQRVMEACRQHVESRGKVPFRIEARYRHKDGATIWVICVGETIEWDEQGQPARIVGCHLDITERKRAEEKNQAIVAELARSNADLQQFVHVASHDLQEPLRAVAGCVALIEKGYADKLDDHGRELMRHVVDGAHRMQALIQDLLAYSRVGTRSKEFGPVDANAALDRALTGLAPSIREHGAVITHAALPTVMADPAQLTQLFHHLISNGIKFCKERRPEIHIGAQSREGDWLFSVRDNGIGIEPQYHERIFVIFQRLHARTEYPGTGIGLAICKRIIERHQGEIWVDSEPGKGSTFYFTIPKQTGPAA